MAYREASVPGEGGGGRCRQGRWDVSVRRCSTGNSWPRTCKERVTVKGGGVWKKVTKRNERMHRLKAVCAKVAVAAQALLRHSWVKRSVDGNKKTVSQVSRNNS